MRRWPHAKKPRPFEIKEFRTVLSIPIEGWVHPDGRKSPLRCLPFGQTDDEISSISSIVVTFLRQLPKSATKFLLTLPEIHSTFMVSFTPARKISVSLSASPFAYGTNERTRTGCLNVKKREAKNCLILSLFVVKAYPLSHLSQSSPVWSCTTSFRWEAFLVESPVIGEFQAASSIEKRHFAGVIHVT